ncbi:hypothetical protein [Halomicronema sp. CCY15110]|uniref:hypothetical protein n=1 Tax=Halomicronema sp. CCY15110 TaxID=2767773 RepID=UPI00195029D6|nr:hypothetical protein [Halomicronema sp. CCY15110]
MPPPIHIESLLLQLPGVTADESRQLAQQVAQILAEDARPRPYPQQIGALNVRIEIPTGLPRDRLAHEIAAAIAARLP